MHRYFVTGTDTGVGKTVVTAALARALRLAGHAPTVAKIVQTGDDNDAADAGAWAECPFVELARFKKPADPWSAALAQGAQLPRADDLAAGLDAIRGGLVAEGSGGILVPLNPDEYLGHAAERAKLRTVIAVGLRLGCINHALLTAATCADFGLPVDGVVLVERWGPTQASYRDDVSRALQDKVRVLGTIAFAPDAAHAAVAGAAVFARLTNDD